jgi:phage terminase large subunit
MPYHERKERFSIGVAHRRCGKTVACINDLIRQAVTCPKPSGRFAYVAPYYNQAKDVAWTYLKHYAGPVMDGVPNESELRVPIIGGHQIRLYGADNPACGAR